jgi:hypothetical protein
MELAQPDKNKSTDDLSLNKPAKKNEGMGGNLRTIGRKLAWIGSPYNARPRSIR